MISQARKRLRKRKEWRTRYLDAVMKVIYWPVGAPDREAAIADACKCRDKVLEWYPPPRAELCLAEIHKRAVEKFRANS